MFRFPIEITGPYDGPRKIGLMHPLLVDHPFVQHVQTLLGIELDPDDAPNGYGYRSGKHAEWWHAVDLVCAGRWQDLLETEQFTTPGYIAGAVAHGLSYSSHSDKKRNGHLSTLEARKVLQHVEAAEPEKPESTLRHLMRPQGMKDGDKRETWPINFKSDDAAGRAWCLVLGIERGWFTYDRSGHLQ